VVVLTDARQPLDPAALSRLTASFADPSVGVVSGELMFRTSESDTAAARGMGAYWTYEKFIRKSESLFRGVPGATGALYALRRELFRPIPEETLLDDVVIPMQAVEQGRRCLLEPGAIAWDVPSQSTAQESIRKRRTIAGAAQLILRQPRWLLPWRNPLWWEYVSHKLARLASPLLLVLLLGTNVLLVAGKASLSPVVYQTLLGAQGVLYLAALCGWGLSRLGRRAPLLGTALMFVALNLTTVLALWDALRGRFRAAWQRAS
jgi:cellulose synthase/poly-beta-1,6-N-acetylglucosamine synthase-like glycosyltransferase